MTEYIVRLYFRGGITMDVPITLAEDEEPDLTWFLGESSEPDERTPVLTEGQYAWKAAEVFAAEWYEGAADGEDEGDTSIRSRQADLSSHGTDTTTAASGPPSASGTDRRSPA